MASTATNDASKFQLPEWEQKPQRKESQPHPQPSLHEQYRSLRFHLSVLYNRTFPPQRRYCGQTRRVFLSIILVSFLALLAIILGLSIGLTRNSGPKNLPLGTEQYSGDLTYYGVGLGACGWAATDREMVVSISHFVFDRVSVAGNPNANPLCGKRLRAVRAGHSVDLRVVDRCVGCQPTDIDVSPAAFANLADPALGRVEVTWAWLDSVPHGK